MIPYLYLLVGFFLGITFAASVYHRSDDVLKKKLKEHILELEHNLWFMEKVAWGRAKRIKELELDDYINSQKGGRHGKRGSSSKVHKTGP